MDKLDRKILELLQANGELAAADVADRVGLSKAPCWRRIKRLQDEGVIRRTVALLDPHSLNVSTTVFVMLKTAHHNEAWFEKFVRAVRDIPEVTEIHRMSGHIDYLMRIVVPDIDAYDVVYKRMIAAVDFLDVSASFSLETIKSTTALPLTYVKLSVYSVLSNDGSFVKIRRHVVCCGADHFDSVIEGLCIWLGSLEAGQERVMNVNAAS